MKLHDDLSKKLKLMHLTKIACKFKKNIKTDAFYYLNVLFESQKLNVVYILDSPSGFIKIQIPKKYKYISI